MNTTLNHIADIAIGYPFRGKIDSSDKDGIPAIQMKNIKDETIDWDSVVRTDLTGKKNPDWLQNGDLLCAGKARSNYFILLQNIPEPSVCSPHFFHLRIKDENQAHPYYLNWLLNSNLIQSKLKAEQMGTTTFSIRKETLQKLEIPLPPLQEQLQLAKLIQTVSQHNQRQQQLIHNNEQLMHSIAQKTFTKYGTQRP